MQREENENRKLRNENRKLYNGFIRHERTWLPYIFISLITLTSIVSHSLYLHSELNQLEAKQDQILGIYDVCTKPPIVIQKPTPTILLSSPDDLSPQACLCVNEDDIDSEPITCNLSETCDKTAIENCQTRHHGYKCKPKI